jgi:hypothetical protein
MSQVNVFHKANNPDFIYFDLQQSNVYNSSKTEPQPLRFNETRDNPIVPNAGEYYLSVNRFQLDTYNLPVLVVEPDLTTGNPNQTIYKVVITAYSSEVPRDTGGTGPLTKNISSVYTSIQPVIWIPDDSLIAPDLDMLNGKNTVEFPYYYCHSYTKFVALVNQAIKKAYIDIINQMWTADFVGTSYDQSFVDIFARAFPIPPYLVWNNLSAEIIANQLFHSIDLVKKADTNYSVPGAVWTNTGGSTHTGEIGLPVPFNLGLSMNANLFSLFNSFPRTAYTIGSDQYYCLTLGATVFDNTIAHPKNSYMPLKTEADLLFNVSPYYNTATNTYTTERKATTNYTYDNYYISQVQEISTIDTWSPVSSIVFTTSTLPIIINQSSAKATIGPEEFSQVVSSGFDLIITDLQTNQQGSRPNVLYNPSAEYRRIDMTGNLPIQIIDISVKWRARTGQIMNFYLPRGGSCSLKILFERKDKKGNNEFRLKPSI